MGKPKLHGPRLRRSSEIALLDVEILARSIYVVVVARWKKEQVRSSRSNREVKRGLTRCRQEQARISCEKEVMQPVRSDLELQAAQGAHPG